MARAFVVVVVVDVGGALMSGSENLCLDVYEHKHCISNQIQIVLITTNLSFLLTLIFKATY